MANNYLIGRDGIKLLRDALGLPDMPIRKMVVTASIDEAISVDIQTFARSEAYVERNKVSDSRYEIIVRKVDNA